MCCSHGFGFRVGAQEARAGVAVRAGERGAGAALWGFAGGGGGAGVRGGGAGVRGGGAGVHGGRAGVRGRELPLMLLETRPVSLPLL